MLAITAKELAISAEIICTCDISINALAATANPFLPCSLSCIIYINWRLRVVLAWEERIWHGSF